MVRVDKFVNEELVIVQTPIYGVQLVKIVQLMSVVKQVAQGVEDSDQHLSAVTKIINVDQQIMPRADQFVN